MALEFRQLGDVGGDAPGLVAAEQLGRLDDPWPLRPRRASSGRGGPPFAITLAAKFSPPGLFPPLGRLLRLKKCIVGWK
jgi:hypothetical protein